MLKLTLKIAIALMVILTVLSLFLCKVAYDKKYNVETAPAPNEAYTIKLPEFECTDNDCSRLEKK